MENWKQKNNACLKCIVNIYLTYDSGKMILLY